MLENKKFNLVLSFILACALWFYVVGQTNPPAKKTYREIPIMLINEQTLNDNGLAVRSTSDSTMRVTLSGRRDTVNKLSKADVVATVDLTEAAEGNNKLPINLKIPENIEIDNQSITDVTVNVEERITKTRDIRVIYTGGRKEGEEPATIKADPESVKVSGAKSLVNKVAYVSTTVDTEDITEELSSTSSALIPVTSSGNQVRNISLSHTKCKITSIMYTTKEVKLTVPVKDNSKDQFVRNTSCQKTVGIKGPASTIAGITEVTAHTVDVTGVSENKKIPVSLILPDDVFVSDKDKDIRLTLKVSRQAKKKADAKSVKSFTFTGDDIEILNAGDTDFAVDQESLEVQVTGTDDQLKKIRTSDIKMKVDAADHNEERFEVEIVAECDKACSDVAVIPSKVTLIRE